MFRVGDGLSETVAREVGSDVSWYALGLGDGYSWDRYATLRGIASENGVLCMPWQRIYDEDDCFALMYVAEQVGFHVLLNIENEFETTLPASAVRPIIDEFPEVQVGISTVAWIYNSVDLSPLAHLPFLLQLFPTDNRWDPADLPTRQVECLYHARVDKGLTYVGTTIQTYADAVPEWFDYQTHVRSYYTGDDMGVGGWEQWKPEN